VYSRAEVAEEIRVLLFEKPHPIKVGSSGLGRFVPLLEERGGIRQHLKPDFKLGFLKLNASLSGLNHSRLFSSF